MKFISQPSRGNKKGEKKKIWVGLANYAFHGRRGEVKSFICKTQWNIAAMSIALTSEARIYHDHNYDSSTQMILFCCFHHRLHLPNVEAHFPSFMLLLLLFVEQKKIVFREWERNSFIKKNLSTHNRIYLDQMQRRMRVARGNEEFFHSHKFIIIKTKKNLFSASF